MFKTIIFFGVSHNFKAKTISPTADSFVTEEIYDVINLVDHMIRLAVALAGLGMVHPSELFSVRFDSFSLLVAKKRRHSGVLNFGTGLEFPFANLPAGLQYADLLGALHVCPGGDWSNLAIFHTCRQKWPLKWQLCVCMSRAPLSGDFDAGLVGSVLGAFLSAAKKTGKDQTLVRQLTGGSWWIFGAVEQFETGKHTNFRHWRSELEILGR